MLEATLV